MRRDGTVFSSVKGEKIHTNASIYKVPASIKRDHIRNNIKVVLPEDISRRNLDSILKLALAGRRAFQIRHDMLVAQIDAYTDIISSTPPSTIPSDHYVYDFSKQLSERRANHHKEVVIAERQTKLLEQALKSPNLKITEQISLPHSMENRRRGIPDLRVGLPIAQERSWGSLADALKEAGCEATTWERLSKDDFDRLASHQETLKHLSGLDTTPLDLVDLFDPEAPVQFFTSKSDALKKEQRERKKLETQVGKLVEPGRSSRNSPGAFVSRKVCRMKGDAEDVLEAYEDFIQLRA
ncbi:hypothetical protein HDU97_001828 [Phlyctochytrium planicorne]|nr:hypothetical protein HDU97_001828 [Phlyctochytrium planicorne]